jgi:beta-galactosidase
MTELINLNNDWRYSNHFDEGMLKVDYDESTFEAVRIPHTNVITPYHYFDEQIYQFISCYRRHINSKEEWRDQTILLNFEAVGDIAKVYLNGEYIMTHEGGYTSFTADLTPYVRLGEDNVLVVVVDSRECNNLPPFGNVIDYMTYGGIYREISLEIKPRRYLEDTYIITREIGSGNEEDYEIELWITLGGEEPEDEQPLNELSLICSVLDQDGKLIHQSTSPVSGQSFQIRFNVSGVKNWELEKPVLYQLELELWPKEPSEEPIDRKRIRFGFRSCEFRKDGFYLNHRKVKLVGLNRHQSYPYVGYAMPERQQRRDAHLLKYELGVNAVRTSHYPQSRHFLDACDELGLLVFTEIPGWQHIGDQEWKDKAVHQVREMVLQYRKHPSIILWGVRINESQDDDEFYARTNRLARELDPTRQTGGVRYLMKSNLLEDVYTYNDFLHNGTNPGLSPKKKVTSDDTAPYLVSEFNGHMYPTKAFDDESHRTEHAIRHATVLDSIFEQGEISGGFGWCMFDYNTHKDFGSGDRICYHGVMDMFRNPKLAASVYASQGEAEAVLELSSSLDIGDHPAGNIRSVYAFTNAESIRVYKNGIFIKEFYPDRKAFGHLPHPPILIDDFVGELLEKEEHYGHKTAETMKQILYAVKQYGPNNLPLTYKIKMGWLMFKEHLTLEDGAGLYYKYIGSWGGQSTSFRFDAIRDGKVMKSVTKSPNQKAKLLVSADTKELCEEATYDVAAIRMRAVDEAGNQLFYYQEPIVLKAEGSVEIIGPTIISLKGGMGGTFIRTLGKSGAGALIISQPQLGEERIEFTVKIIGI